MSDLMTCGVIAGLMLGGVIVVAVIAKVREVRAAARWTATPGKVITSKVQARRERGDDSATVGNYPLVEYEYEVGGRTHTGSRISIGEEAANSEVAETLARYPVDAGVLVYYDPKDPAKCVLERNFPPGLGKGLFILLLFLVGGPIGLALVFSSLPEKVAPHLPNPKGAPFVVALTFMGLFVLLIGRAMRKQATDAKRWPAAEGLVLTSRVEPFEWKTKNGAEVTMYRPDLVYAYEVEGHRYAGSRIGLGGVTRASTPKWSEKSVAKYPQGAAVRVYYDPQNPAESVLERHAHGSLLVWIISAVLFSAAYFIATRKG